MLSPNYPARPETDGFKPMVSPALTSGIDIVPTIMDIAGLLPDPELPGRSLLPMVQGRPFQEPEAVYAEWSPPPIRTIRTREWKYNLYLHHGDELYDLKNDPHELRNLAGDPKTVEIQMGLKQKLEEFIDQQKDPFFSLPASGKKE
jgi:arylsulfatase A-like enzyme